VGITWHDIDGWLDPDEAEVLQLLSVGRDVLELGSFKGRSTVCLAEFARTVVSVDWHRGDAACGHADTSGEFLDNLERAGVAEKVVPVRARVENAELPERAFDLVFIDDDHTNDAPLTSTRMALRCLRRGGTIAWHDWYEPAVQRAAELCGLVPTSFRNRLAWVTIE
jgi:predicted O-methyltransferase YrrM